MKLKKILYPKPTPKRIILSIFFILICLLCFVYLAANWLIFPGYSSLGGDSYDIIKLTSANGNQISAVYFSNPDANYTILYSHGNGEDIEMIRPSLELYQRNGFALLAYDYQGYGTSEGKATEKNVYQDIEAAYSYLINDLNTPPDKIISLGRSVGSGPSCYLAEKYPIAGLIVESGFTSAFRVVTQYPLLPFDRFPNSKRLEKITCPVLFIHGKKDRTVLFGHALKNFDSANEPKMKFWLDNAGHNDVMSIAGEKYFLELQQFVELIENQ